MGADPAASAACPVCRTTPATVFFETRGVPVLCNRLWPTRDAAVRAPVADVRLGHCSACDHIFNVAFDPAAVTYTPEYENALHFSARFREYATALAAQLIERYELRGKTIVEIGAADGHFLRLLCHLGGNRGVGFDPSYWSAAEPSATTTRGVGASAGAALNTAPSVTLIADVYSERYTDCRPDLVCCRHVLEHLADPAGFLLRLRRVLNRTPHTALFFEVPNASFMVPQRAIWDVIYEHYSYFSVASLVHLFATAGFDVRDVRPAFGDEFLCVEAVATKGGQRPRTRPDGERGERVRAFAVAAAETCTAYRERLARAAAAGQRTIVWGAGSKGVTFLNRLGKDSGIEVAVDINPRKHGRFVPGTGQQVVPPDYLRPYQPNLILLMNPIYESEVRAHVGQLGIDASVVTV